MKYNFPRVSRARLKIIDEKSLEIGDGTTTAPTEEEHAWLDIMKMSNPETEKLRKKIYVCTLAEVIEYSPEFVTFSYDENRYTIKKPVNGFKIARARERSIMEALEELNDQRVIVQGAVPINKDFSGVDAEVIGIMANVAESFFFTPYL